MTSQHGGVEDLQLLSDLASLVTGRRWLWGGDSIEVQGPKVGTYYGETPRLWCSFGAQQKMAQETLLTQSFQDVSLLSQSFLQLRMGIRGPEIYLHEKLNQACRSMNEIITLNLCETMSWIA